MRPAITETKPAYWIAHVTITDAAVYDSYRRLAFAAVTGHGGRFLARGGRYRQMEGRAHAWNTLAVFPSFEAARACYEAPAYQEALALARRSSERDLVIVEGA